MSATQVLHKQHKCNMSATQMTQMQHKCYNNSTSMEQVKNFDFNNEMSKNTLPHPYISYVANERLQGEVQFHSKNYILEICSHAKMHLKSALQKLNFNGKSYIKQLYTCSHKNMHSNTALFSIKTTLCETNNILLSKNY